VRGSEEDPLLRTVVESLLGALGKNFNVEVTRCRKKIPKGRAERPLVACDQSEVGSCSITSPLLSQNAALAEFWDYGVVRGGAPDGWVQGRQRPAKRVID